MMKLLINLSVSDWIFTDKKPWFNIPPAYNSSLSISDFPSFPRNLIT